MVSEIQIKDNEFYLVIQKAGHIFKTRDKTEFLVICSWEENNDLLIKEIVKNSQYLFFKTGKEVKKKRINQIPVSKPFEEKKWYDVYELNLDGGSRIKKAWIGGKDDGEEIEDIFV